MVLSIEGNRDHGRQETEGRRLRAATAGQKELLDGLKNYGGGIHEFFPGLE